MYHYLESEIINLHLCRGKVQQRLLQHPDVVTAAVGFRCFSPGRKLPSGLLVLSFPMLVTFLVRRVPPAEQITAHRRHRSPHGYSEPALLSYDWISLMGGKKTLSKPEILAVAKLC